MKSSIIKYFVCFLAITCLLSCEKYLDEKSDKVLSTPDTLDDLQAMLDNEYITYAGIQAAQTGADDYFVPQSTFDMGPEFLQMLYYWDASAETEFDWNDQYKSVLIANTVLDRVAKMPSGQKNDEVKGTALFLRAYFFYQLAQLYAPQYDPSTANSDLGIVLRLEPDFLIPSKRATVKQTYNQIIADLQEAQRLVPQVAIANTRPNKAAVFALLARTLLQIGDFQNAKDAAAQSLQQYDKLIDYNNTSEVDTTSDNPIINNGLLNKEILFYNTDQGSYKMFPEAYVDSVLYQQYDNNDIRKAAFFVQSTATTDYRFKGSYVPLRLFIGLSTPEVYLIKAEAEARLGNTATAIQDLNTLLIKRYQTGAAPAFNPSSPEEALGIILLERKKEMVWRGMRWADLKRLNKNPATATIVRRYLNGAIYELAPNDKKYTLLIPDVVIQLSNLEQNPR